MKILLLQLLVFGALILPSSMASAQPKIAPQPCDAQYWRQMSSRAWLEAEREIMQNQNLIFKPDSVLEYVCFDQFASIAAWPGGNIFVHTEYFGKKIIERSAPGAMQTAVTAVVSNALDAYHKNYFEHSFLGGRSEHMGAEATNKGFKFEPASKNIGYTCQKMSKIWKAAKCANFVDNSEFEDKDGFYPFEAIKGFNGSKSVGGYDDKIKDARQYPEGMECGGNLGLTNWREQIDLSNNIGGKDAQGKTKELYPFKEPLGKIFTEVGKKLKPGECKDESGAAAKGIPTGIRVIVNGKDSHADGVCTNPGCTYTKDGTCS